MVAHTQRRCTSRLARFLIIAAFLCALWTPTVAFAYDPIVLDGQIDYRALLRAGGVIGYLTLGLSVAMVALVVEHLLTVRRRTFLPKGLADEIHGYLQNGRLLDAEAACREKVCFLSYLVNAGLQEVAYGFPVMEKAMEDAAAEQSARLARRIEYLALISSMAPLLGLMGTVWGMIQAFGEFALRSNPSAADFAPSISEALVCTLFGLIVAVLAQFGFAIFRNRIDEYVAEASLIAIQTVNPLKKTAGQPRPVGVSPPKGESVRRAPPPPAMTADKSAAD